MPDWNKYFSEDVPPVPIKIGRLHNGIYTLVLPDGSHRTFRIATQYPGSWAAGRRTIGLLVGPDNEDTAEYEKFGFVTEDGIAVWKSLRGTGDKPSKFKQWSEVIWRIANEETIGGYELLEARACIKCNRLLTDPESIMIGAGPTCREYIGF